MFNLVLWSFVLALTPWTVGLAWKRFSAVGEWNREPPLAGNRGESKNVEISRTP